MTSRIQTDKTQFHPSFSSFIPDFLQPKRSSRIGELLLSNKSPLEFEKQDLVETAARGPQFLDEFDEKIAATRQLLDFLVSERDQAASNISDAKSLLHPVRRLPDDVLRAVFRACTKSPGQAFDGELAILVPTVDIESVQPNQLPWTVSCVCQQWRTVAIQTAELWSFIELNLDNRVEDEELAQNRVFRLGLSLFRANGHDLSIRLYGEKSVPDVSPILQILFPTAPYWRRLSAFLPLTSFRRFSVCEGYLNRLDTLYVGSREVNVPHIDAFQLAPNLQVLGTIRWDRAFTRFYFPFSGITTFLSGGGTIHSYESLKRLSHIQTLFLMSWNFTDEPAGPTSFNSVTVLHMLELPLPGFSSIANMYSLLILPSLQTLKLSFFGCNPISFPFIANPDSCTIKSLYIEICDQPQEACARLGYELSNFLCRTLQLEELHIMVADTALPDQWANGLVYTSGQYAAAPRLRVLSMSRGCISAGALDSLVNIIESRRRKDVDSSGGGHCALLERVVLGPGPVEFGDEELSDRWSTLLAGGLIVTRREE
ncbi:hypothetical protein ARMSODRAFT_962420 [Armillaria solidipes]|uniref:F-box domain-containing protein n=1 Tax=Armillaria solidipes TaxID=1076256 RepID=A0A2H3B011_9AGAR|nr:hypothetical protein ARMSODRAFT_962420 [Armillaria solidipes]